MTLKNLENSIEKQYITPENAQADFELEALKMLQRDISIEIVSFMSENSINLEQLASKLNEDQITVYKMIKGDANINLKTIAKLYTLLGKEARIVSYNPEEYYQQ